MKKLDKLILQSFIGPFILTFFVVVFILLTQYMLKYFEEFVGKDLGFYVFAELLMYFSINMTPVALPLAVLLSSLMTFGNLGEHFELTAIKSAGISLTRILLPLFVFVCGLSVLAFFSNNYIVPKANLNAYSLLYDIKQTKPSLDIKEGAFYTGIPDYSIKVDKKYPDGETLGDLIIYDHKAGLGNTQVILADSGRMSFFNNNNYLMFELFNGNSYKESETRGNRYDEAEDFFRNSFDKSKIVFSLASFGLKETKKELFASNRLMKHAGQLTTDIDSMSKDMKQLKFDMYTYVNRHFSYHLRNAIEAPKEMIPEDILEADQISVAEKEKRNTHALTVKERKKQIKTPSAKPLKSKTKERVKETKVFKPKANVSAKVATRDTLSKKKPNNHLPDKEQPVVFSLTPIKPITKNEIDSFNGPLIVKIQLDTLSSEKIAKHGLPVESWAKYDSIFHVSQNKQKLISKALGQARFIKNNLNMQETRIYNLKKEINTYIIEKNKKYSQAFACLVMFLIGAPLGAIIKKGGLGVPVIISVCFFIVFYVMSITSEKWGKEDLIDPILASWVANIFLLPFGIFFLRQARNDVRVFESDFYKVTFDKFKTRFKNILPG